MIHIPRMRGELGTMVTALVFGGGETVARQRCEVGCVITEIGGSITFCQNANKTTNERRKFGGGD